MIETAMGECKTYQRRSAGVRIVVAWQLPSHG